MKIGLIGASSQVAASVAYYLKNFTDTEVKCFIRSSYSAVFFDLHNIPYDSIDLGNKADIKEKLEDCDTVIDFTYPVGELYSIPTSIDYIIKNIVSSLSGKQVFIYMSSIMAYGTPPMQKNIKSYFFPRSSYAYIKRKAERKCSKMGKICGIKTYNFRLGQVHGFLQSVNTSFREKLHQNNIAFIDGMENDLTNTVFISTVSEAIIKFSRGQESPGTYTLISDPQWTLKQLYEYYIQAYNIPVTLNFSPGKINKQNFNFNFINVLKRYRPILETYVLMNIPSLAIKIKGRYRQNEVRLLKAGQTIEYIDYNLLGKPDKQVITGIKSDYQTVFNLEKEMEETHNKLIKLNRI